MSETLMNGKYPNLSWILDNINESKRGMNLKHELFEKYGDNPEYLLEFETLIQDLRYLGCKGLQGKIIQGTNLNQFVKFVSELKFSKILIDNKKSTELLLDRDPRFGEKQWQC